MERLFSNLLNREELSYRLPSDTEPYHARARSRWDTPEHCVVFGNTLRKLASFRGTRLAMRRKGFEQEINAIAKASVEQNIQLLEDRVHRAKGLEQLASDPKMPQPLRTAFRQALIATAEVPFTDGYQRALRHEGHNLNVRYGSLKLFVTANFADAYSPLAFSLVDDSAEQPGETQHQIRVSLTDEEPDMPTLKRMHQLLASSPRGQSKFFLLMDDLVDLHLLGIDNFKVGSHGEISALPHHLREDGYASSGVPGLSLIHI